MVVDILDTAPDTFLDITYPGNKKINFGRVLKPNEVQSQPEVKWNAESNTFYTLMMVDPDAPSYPQPTNRSIKRWLVGNIPGNNISGGDVLASYSGPEPLPQTGLHRYVFLLYKQNGKVNFNEPQTKEARLHFNVREFMKKYGLGDPIAGNLFESQWHRN